MKENLIVIFGGASSEHDVSIISALQAINYIDVDYYNVIPVYIDQNNVWYTGKILKDITNYKNLKTKRLKQVSIIAGHEYLYQKFLFGYYKKLKIDCALVIMHGINGEDGKVMSLLDLAGIPYQCSNTCESSICLDKTIFKDYLNGLKVNNVKGVGITQYLYNNNPEKIYQLLENEIEYPMIVKPATQGSSIGIKVCYNRTQLEDAIVGSFELGEKVLIEQFLDDITEINVAIVRDDDKLIVSELEQPLKSSDILSFENKYLNESNSMQGISRIIPAPIDDKTKSKIKDMAIKVYENLNLKGVVRFDFILNKDNVYLNEVNSIPGSLAYYLFEPLGIDYNKLINILIKNTYLYETNTKKKIHRYFSNILDGTNISIKK